MAMPLTTHRFTVAEYQRMGEAGVFREDDRVELIDGQVVEMSPIGPRHAACVDRLTRVFSQRLGDRAVVRVRSPIVLGRHAAPQPDVTLLQPPIERYAEAHPEARDTLLVIEVADTTADYDRSVKVSLYARAGIAEVWLVDLEAHSIELSRTPKGGRYSDRRTARSGEIISPSVFPTVQISTDEVLGSR
ncbi:MAG TPA: Uma2 family endonuclease [Gemmatimonadales bacterium]|nr:Uma2 family endonuclease [Gemmatimonadales bacterium]